MAMALLIAVKEERVFILLPGNPGKHPTPVARLLRVMLSSRMYAAAAAAAATAPGAAASTAAEACLPALTAPLCDP